MTGRVLLGVFFIGAGFLHFVFPEPYLRMVPPLLPRPEVLVWISGVAEIIGGIGLLLPQWQRAAALGTAVVIDRRLSR
jgi:uncharacterized membrane protein